MNPTPFIQTPIERISRLQKPQLVALHKLGIKTVGDMLYHFPVRYGDNFSATYIKDALPETSVTLYGKLTKVESGRTYKSKVLHTSAILNDESGKIKLFWFNQIYIGKMFKDGDSVKVSGIVKDQKGQHSIINPNIEKTTSSPLVTGTNLFGESKESLYLPIYRESKGISSLAIHHVIKKILTHVDFKDIEDTIPEDIRSRYKLPSLQSSLIYIHTPKKEADAEAAKKRFAFEEVFYIQLANAKQKHDAEQASSYSLLNLDTALEEFKKHLDFTLTDAQEKAVHAIIGDLKKDHPMSRLLEGDVGSGKTAVAAAASYAVISSRIKSMRTGDTANSRLQVAYMAPTEILAKQHYESFVKLFKNLPVNIGLLTGSGCKKFPSKSALQTQKFGTDISKSQLLKWIASGDISIVIGTHALIQKSVVFKDLAFVIIDEQHRFGTKQRQKLANKHLSSEEERQKKAKKDSLRVHKKVAYIDNKYNPQTPQVVQTPHLLSMTATPIPRTLALTVYGDLDLTVVDQMPSGRKPVITTIVPDHERRVMYDFVNKELDAGRQAYVICARIADPDPDLMTKLNLRSVQEEAKRLASNEFKGRRIGILHSKMKPQEKEKVMKDLLDHKIDVLVATSVVEVGVNVPNASCIIIEGADRFGLSQLHQLRGRVIRGTNQPYCYLCTSTKSEKSIERLQALRKATNGFELSELDLQMRGAGDLYGDKQWGLTDIGMEAIKNLKMVEAARTEAYRLVENHLLTDHMNTYLRSRELLHME